MKNVLASKAITTWVNLSRIISYISSICLALNLAACAFSRDVPAPIIYVTKAPAPFTKKLAKPNKLEPKLAMSTNDKPVIISKIKPNSSQVIIKNINTSDNISNNVNTNTNANNTNKVANKTDSSATIRSPSTSKTWIWPVVKGKVIANFTPILKGIDISGKLGQAIYASNEGKIVYSGNGLKGYGNLIIIKHPEGYLTAYAHNKVNLMHEGDKVAQGQKIAELGNTDSDQPILHFELRKNGKPLDPLGYLPSQ